MHVLQGNVQQLLSVGPQLVPRTLKHKRTNIHIYIQLYLDGEGKAPQLELKVEGRAYKDGVVGLGVLLGC